MLVFHTRPQVTSVREAKREGKGRECKCDLIRLGYLTLLAASAGVQQPALGSASRTCKVGECR